MHALRVNYGHYGSGRLISSGVLLEKGYTVVGVVRRTSTENNGRIQHLQDDLVLEAGDLHDQYSLIEIMQRHRPDEVYNLAAQSFVAASWRQPVLTGEVTALGATRVLEAIRVVDPTIKFYQASSSEMFGEVQEWPQRESTPFYPRSPYGVAKLYAHWITVNYRESYRMFACSGICFNHESPRRGMEFVTRKLSYSAARVHHEVVQSVPFGDLSTRRDWGYAPDFVRGMWLMLQQDEPRDYVLATGENAFGSGVCRPSVRPPGTRRPGPHHNQRGPAASGGGASPDRRSLSHSQRPGLGAIGHV